MSATRRSARTRGEAVMYSLSGASELLKYHGQGVLDDADHAPPCIDAVEHGGTFEVYFGLA